MSLAGYPGQITSLSNLLYTGATALPRVNLITSRRPVSQLCDTRRTSPRP